jgi:hypothetical protein
LRCPHNKTSIDPNNSNSFVIHEETHGGQPAPTRRPTADSRGISPPMPSIRAMSRASPNWDPLPSTTTQGVKKHQHSVHPKGATSPAQPCRTREAAPGPALHQAPSSRLVLHDPQSGPESIGERYTLRHASVRVKKCWSPSKKHRAWANTRHEGSLLDLFIDCVIQVQRRPFRGIGQIGRG